MFRLRTRVCIAAVAMTLLSSTAPAGSECDELRGDEQILPGEVVPYLGGAWTHPDLPAGGDIDDVIGELDSNDERPRSTRLTSTQTALPSCC